MYGSIPLKTQFARFSPRLFPVRSKGSRDKVMIKTDPPELIFHVEAEINGSPGTNISEM